MTRLHLLVSNDGFPWQIRTSEEAASCTWEQPQWSLHCSCQGTWLEGVARSLQNRSPTAMCVHTVHTAAPRQSANRIETAQHFLCAMCMPPQKAYRGCCCPWWHLSKGNQGDFPTEKPRLKKKVEVACISASRALGEHVCPIARAVLPAVDHAVPVLPLRGCHFGRHEVIHVWSSSCCCLQPWVWLQRHLGIVGLGGQDSGQHQL